MNRRDLLKLLLATPFAGIAPAASASQPEMFKFTSLSSQDVKYVEFRQFSITEIARIYAVPPYLLAELQG